MSEFATVTAHQGQLRGRRRQTSTGSSFVSFEGVPYAKAPLGALRFKPPQPAEPWSGIRDATKPGSHSLQNDIFKKTIKGSEDCLFLNVYTPGLPSDKNDASLRPVLFYIHGGGFTSGYGDLFRPDPFLEEEVVVVTFNYRLGFLGFLSLETLDVPGNAGLKDQTMALRWVKENIAMFGGDPDNITIFGESAGGASVHYQVLSPLSKGLFQRAIAQSGSAFCSWALATEPAARAKRLALTAGCDASIVNDTAALTKWLQEAPALKLLTATAGALTPQDYSDGFVLAFGPSVEPAHPDAFLPTKPRELIATGHVPKMPIIFGVTSDEGMMFLPECLVLFSYFIPPTDPQSFTALSPEQLSSERTKKLKELASDLAGLLPDDLPNRRDPKLSSELCQRLKNYFFHGKELSEDTIDGLVKLYSDMQFVLGGIRSARVHAEYGSPTYMYEFAFSGKINFISKMLNMKGTVCLADELSYVFCLPKMYEPEVGSPEALVRKRLVRLWTNFARKGDPTPAGDELIPINWPQFSDKLNYLRIDEDLKVETGLFLDRLLFWKDMYGT